MFLRSKPLKAMILDINNPMHAETIARYLSGEMEDIEQTEFEEFTCRNSENMKLIQSMKKQWKAMDGYKDKGSPDAIKAWEKLHARLAEDHLIPAQSLVARKFLQAKITGIAAVALILISVGVFLYLSMNRQNSVVAMIQLSTLNDPNTRIKTLSDGSTIYIAQNSTFSYPKEFAKDQRNVGLKGEAFFDVAPDPGKPFIIETDKAIIEVLGTAFNVKTNNGSNFELIVSRGKVKVTLKEQPETSKLVVAGEKISSINSNLVKSTIRADEIPNWYKRRLHFKDEMLQNILHILNQNFNTTFAKVDPEIGNRRLTVTFDNESSGTITELICLSLNLKSQIRNDSIVFSDFNPGARNN